MSQPVPVMVAWIVTISFIGPLPMPVVLAMNIVAIGAIVWEWRTARFKLERIPTDSRDEV